MSRSENEGKLKICRNYKVGCHGVEPCTSFLSGTRSTAEPAAQTYSDFSIGRSFLLQFNLSRSGGEVANTAVCKTATRGCKSRPDLMKLKFIIDQEYDKKIRKDPANWPIIDGLYKTTSKYLELTKDLYQNPGTKSAMIFRNTWKKSRDTNGSMILITA